MAHAPEMIAAEDHHGEIVAEDRNELDFNEGQGIGENVANENESDDAFIDVEHVSMHTIDYSFLYFCLVL